jgi:hypothetical protein
VKQNRYILRKLLDAIKFCVAFELALRGHDERVESNNPGIFRGLINLIAEVDDILKLHIDQSKNTVFTGTDMDSNKKVLGTIRIDPSVPSLSIWSRAATERTTSFKSCSFVIHVVSSLAKDILNARNYPI